jgi:hypothetical protein
VSRGPRLQTWVNASFFTRGVYTYSATGLPMGIYSLVRRGS